VRVPEVSTRGEPARESSDRPQDWSQRGAPLSPVPVIGPTSWCTPASDPGPVLRFLREHHGPTLHFWTAPAAPRHPSPATQDLCDVLYVLHLLDWPLAVHRAATERFVDHLARLELAGRINGAGERRAGVHLSAYVLGTLTLVREYGIDLFERVMAGNGWRLDTLLDPSSSSPKWPRAWSHHSWRVSHWIGGTLAILRMLERHASEGYSRHGMPPVRRILEATDDLIDPETGFLKCYRSRLLHTVFQQLYRLRHDPILGEIGGIAHVHWVNHALGRPFKAGDRLFRAAWRAMSGRSPFMERTPYCLDFDVVHLVRTAKPADLDGAQHAAIAERAKRYVGDLDAFFRRGLGSGYALHKLPGALAAREACRLLAGHDPADATRPRTKDLIQVACWL